MTSINSSQGAPNTPPAVKLVPKNVVSAVGSAAAGVVLGAVGGAATNMVQGAVMEGPTDEMLKKTSESKKDAHSSEPKNNEVVDDQAVANEIAKYFVNKFLTLSYRV